MTSKFLRLLAVCSLSVFAAVSVASAADTDSASVSASGKKLKTLKVYNEKFIPDSMKDKYAALMSSQSESGAPVPMSDPAPVMALAPQPEQIAPAQVQDVQPASGAEQAVSKVIEAKRTPPLVEGSVKGIETWRARKGENVRDILQRWSTRSDVDLLWAASDAPELDKDFSFVGSYEDAVNELIRQAGGDGIHSQFRSEGMNPVMMLPASMVRTASPVNSETAASSQGGGDTGFFSRAFRSDKKSEIRQETRWFGLSGASLAEVLRVWADDSGVKLVWQAEHNYALKSSVSEIGHFEDAVFSALSQYDGETDRPVGQIYRDPQTGDSVLLIRSDRNS